MNGSNYFFRKNPYLITYKKRNTQSRRRDNELTINMLDYTKVDLKYSYVLESNEQIEKERLF